MLQLTIPLRLNEDRDILSWLAQLPDNEQEPIIRNILRQHIKQNSSMFAAAASPPVDPLPVPTVLPNVSVTETTSQQDDDIDRKLLKMIDSF